VSKFVFAHSNQEKIMSERSRTPLLLSFAGGAAAAALVMAALAYRKFDKANAGATGEGNDLSLFYGNEKELTNITEARKFLPKEIYGHLVRDTVVCCVDIVLVRHNEERSCKECLLVERSTEPAKGLWWWPGGRLLKGETFFDAARRKAFQETGLTNVTPIQILGVWNTFFPTSAWDTDSSKGTQTVNPIVLVELNDVGGDVKLDETSENYKWIELDPQAAIANGEDRYVVQALLRLQAWTSAYITTF
jgi:colanic acid biosynthesis protein WcaH